MTFLLNKFSSVVEKILHDKGSVDFFAVIKRFDAENKWDILLSADWIKETNSQVDLVYIIELLMNEYEGKIDFISKILTLSPTEEFVADIAEAVTKNNLSEGYTGELLLTDDVMISQISIIALNVEKYKKIKLTNQNNNQIDELVFE